MVVGLARCSPCLLCLCDETAGATSCFGHNSDRVVYVVDVGGRDRAKPIITSFCRGTKYVPSPVKYFALVFGKKEHHDLVRVQ